MTVQVIALPGGVMPAALRYAYLATALGVDVSVHPKDLEVYAGERPSVGYSIGFEVEAVVRFADSLGLDRFHLLGYSGGGFVSLAFAGAYPERLLSLALFEPASVPGRLSPEEAALEEKLKRGLGGLTGDDFMGAFMKLQLRPGVEVARPVTGPPPPWMSKRPAGLAAMMAAFGQHPFERARLRECRFPVFLGYGELTGEQEEVKAGILARLFSDVHIRRFDAIHHFVPADQLYNAEHVDALRSLFSDAGDNGG